MHEGLQFEDGRSSENFGEIQTYSMMRNTKFALMMITVYSGLSFLQ